MVSMLRVFRGRPGRVHTAPQANWVTSFWKSSLKDVAVRRAASTYFLPRTSLRTSSPSSNSSGVFAMSRPPLRCSRAQELEHCAGEPILRFDVREVRRRKLDHLRAANALRDLAAVLRW